MTATATGLRLSDGAVAVPSYAETHMNRDISAIVAKVAPEDPTEERGDEAPDELKIAAEEVLAALGQDYGSGPNADRGQREAFEDKRDRLVASLWSFFEICDSLPHREGGHE